MEFLANILDWRDGFKRKRIHTKEYDYISSFYQAQLNTRALKLNEPTFKFDEGYSSEISGTVSEDIREVIHETVYSYSQEIIAFNCFDFALMAQRALKINLNLNTVLTLGSYSDSGTKLFYESLAKLKFRLRNPHYKSEGINLHAWLTLADWRIIDVSILSALKLFGKFQEQDYRNFYYMNAKEQRDNNTLLAYHPILIGNDYLNKIHLKPKLLFTIY